MKHNKFATLLLAAACSSAALARVSQAEGVCPDAASTEVCCSEVDHIEALDVEVLNVEALDVEALNVEALTIEASDVDTPARCFSLKEGWFLEAGLDMNMINPYGLPFSEVFPKGRSHGVDVAFGKYFTPDVAIRARLNWENGLPLLENKRLEWLCPVGPNGRNMDAGGCIWAYMDVMASIPSLCGYRNYNRRWDVLLVPRAGFGTNRYLHSLSPVVGMGAGFTYRLTPRVKLYADLNYQGITSEFFGDSAGDERVSGTGMDVPTAFNGILTLQAGVQFNIGRLTH